MPLDAPIATTKVVGYVSTGFPGILSGVTSGLLQSREKVGSSTNTVGFAVITSSVSGQKSEDLLTTFQIFSSTYRT